VINKLWLWLAGVLAVVGGLFAYGSKKKSDGKDEAKNEQQEKVLDNVKKAKDSEDDSANESVDKRIERMRKRARGNK